MNTPTAPEVDVNQLVADNDTGARAPGPWVSRLLLYLALAWSLFQLWIASPLPFSLGVLVFNDTETRAIHLAFAVFLSYMAYPAFRRSPRAYVPLVDWALAFVGAFCASYLFLFYSELATRPGQPTQMDVITAAVGVVLLLEATRRVLGLPMVIVALVFLIYTFGGPYMPDMIAHRGFSLNRAMSHQWLTTEGVFGVALGVSSSFIFLFVLFGSLLDKAGAGNYFIKSAFALLGHMRGGPAKAAVLSSAATGIISGSSIANVVTTGTFTIPLMKRVGYRADQAGAVEVSSSVNGQIMPPVMGAAAFLMVEYVGIPYIEVMKHAFLPAIISYIALVYIVHLEALKANMVGLPRRNPSTRGSRLLAFALTVAGFLALSGAVYWGIGWIKSVAGEAAIWIVGVGLLAAYVGLLWFGAKQPVLELDDPNAPVFELPETAPTVKSGLHYLLAVVVLIWCLMVEQMSPGLSAFWATLFMIFVMVTQKPITAAFRGHGGLAQATRQGFADLIDGLATGARNMIGIGVATAAAGIIVGTVSLTGVGLVMTELVELLSGGNLMLMLVLVAFISLILGMGLPTTANYIVVSTLMAPVVVELGAQSGLIVPLIAVHLFVFYFGLMADVTPPVGLASFAAAAIARADPIKTGITAFAYSMRTAILPFLFIFNTQLLLMGLTGPFHLILTVVSATVAMLVFAAATQGYFLVRSRWYESLALLLITFTLFRPGFWWDMVYPPYNEVLAAQMNRLIEEAPANAGKRLWIEGTNLNGDDIRKGVLLPLGAQAPARERLASAGVSVVAQGDELLISGVKFGSVAEKLGIEQGFRIVSAEVPTERPAKEWLFLPALALLLLVMGLQRLRLPRKAGAGAAAGSHA
ncbi:MAG: C4-dicarboxylate ABC transporter [Burkholderiales bacterium RIFCSPLOWO2_12_67_14]|nr:MAG: C4-dicarboxylate ABC transporter [Burkholderiales bacterium RIFCSPLOWO2_02_FULL_67_64]OGB35834.1 MAG: C4-dicarboxylate ABC transporter [Burkholderiales bacterium RIFCSPHIGHO2_12_FULL_67_38]OGB43389.1 MAG: C4-dicarboxylate ABC transporter [Burkholderiales bacterium RIFCSPLOWO2_12_67_14]OGB98112.1 MAG: C4-dicarboxylate ABC transporter [Burkholderiales bacterium RIFCSPLOWO2_12_FULL_67_210]